MSRFRAPAVGLAVAVAIVVALVVTPVLGARPGPSTEIEARTVVHEFFRTINDRRFARTCDLLSGAFYRRNRVPSKRACMQGLQIGFTWSPEIHYRITGVHMDGDRATVEALANGAPGRIVLVRERSRFRVLAVEAG
jgi:hypothetical protein